MAAGRNIMAGQEALGVPGPAWQHKSMIYLILFLAPFHAHATNEIHVERLSGQALYDHKPVRAGQDLDSGGLLEVDAEPTSYLDFKLKDGHEFRLKNKTKIRLSGRGPAGPSELELLAGKIFAYFRKTKTAPSLKLKTAVAVAGVRGTKFMLEVDAVKGTYVCVCDGTVHIEGLGPRSGDGVRDVTKDQDLWISPTQPMGSPAESMNMSQMTKAEFQKMDE